MKEAKQSRIDAERKAKEWLKNDLKNNAKITFFFAPDSKKITQAEKEVLEDPCLKCNCCKRRFAQVSIIIVNAQGMLDKRILTYLGAVFRHPRYEHFSLEEWSQVSLDDCPRKM